MTNAIRPHVAAFLALGMGAAYLLYGLRGQRSLIGWIVGAGVVTAFVVYMVQSGAQFLSLDELSFDTIEAQMRSIQGLTTQGGP
ncbi:MAG: hypothetical protein R2867_16935 [Caldilineaceae bacterium]